MFVLKLCLFFCFFEILLFVVFDCFWLFEEWLTEQKELKKYLKHLLKKKIIMKKILYFNFFSFFLSFLSRTYFLLFVLLFFLLFRLDMKQRSQRIFLQIICVQKQLLNIFKEKFMTYLKVKFNTLSLFLFFSLILICLC